MTVTDADHRGKIKREPGAGGEWVVYCAGYDCTAWEFLRGNYPQSYRHAKKLGYRRQKFDEGYLWRCFYCVDHDCDVRIGSHD